MKDGTFTYRSQLDDVVRTIPVRECPNPVAVTQVLADLFGTPVTWRERAGIIPGARPAVKRQQ